jgi:hypothetical protein
MASRVVEILGDDGTGHPCTLVPVPRKVGDLVGNLGRIVREQQRQIGGQSLTYLGQDIVQLALFLLADPLLGVQVVASKVGDTSLLGKALA